MRANLVEKAVGVGLGRAVTLIVRANFIFVRRACFQARHEQLPNAGVVAGFHRVGARVPAVEVANQRNAVAVRRPDGEIHAGHALYTTRVRAEFLVDFVVLALAKEVNIVFSQQRREAIGIAENFRLVLVCDGFKMIGCAGPARVKLSDKQALLMPFAHGRLAAGYGVDDRDCFRPGPEDANGNLVAQLVPTQYCGGRADFAPGQGVNRIRMYSERHKGPRWLPQHSRGIIAAFA